MSNVLLYDQVNKEVNNYINKADAQVLLEIANKVFNQEWEYYQYRKVYRIDGYDAGQGKVLKRFYGMYNDATPHDIVEIYNYIHKTDFAYDKRNNILKVKESEA